MLADKVSDSEFVQARIGSRELASPLPASSMERLGELSAVRGPGSSATCGRSGSEGQLGTPHKASEEPDGDEQVQDEEPRLVEFRHRYEEEEAEAEEEDCECEWEEQAPEGCAPLEAPPVAASSVTARSSDRARLDWLQFPVCCRQTEGGSTGELPLVLTGASWTASATSDFGS